MAALIKRKPAAAPAPKPKTDGGKPLHLKYRPRILGDVVGQDGTVQSLQTLFKRTRDIPQSFLFTGPAGTGKTTLARIIAEMVQAEAVELDAARFAGIDDMRGILTGAQYRGLTAKADGRKCYIVDEAHALSKQAWQTMLKSIEEPQPHLYWVLCTTEAGKVPPTIVTRCHAYNLRGVPTKELMDYIDSIAELEGIDAQYNDLIAQRANGSVRQALVFLSMLDGVADAAEAARLLSTSQDADESSLDFQLAKLLVYGKASWKEAQRIIQQLKENEANPEGVRITMVNTAGAALLKETNPDRARMLLSVIQNFSFPYNPSEKWAPILLATGSLLLG